MTKEQEYLEKVFNQVKSSVQDKGGMAVNLIKMMNQFQKFPFAAIARSEFRDGDIVFTDFSDSIQNIVGYTREELIGKTLSDITHGELDGDLVAETIYNLETYGFCPKSNTNNHKFQNTPVRTFGMIFKEGEGKYIELIMDMNKVVYYDN